MKQTDDYLFLLYKKVQQNNKDAKKELKRLHKEKWPHHHRADREYLTLHQMYLHLTK